MASIQGDGEQISLNIMPLLDVFSILILFLLMSFSTDPLVHDVNKDLELPTSLTTVALDELPSLVLSKTEIYVNDKKVLDLVDGAVPPELLSQGAIKPLYEELKTISDNVKKLGLQTEKAPGLLTVEADKTHSFKLLKQVMLSAQQAEFIKFKLMVSKNVQ